MDTDAGIGCTWPACHEANAGSSGQLTFGFRHIGRTALLTRHYKFNLIGELREPIQGRQVALSGHAVNPRDALRYQSLN